MFQFALAIGMSPEQYWFDNPELFYHYKEAYVLKSKKTITDMWTMGLYIKSALASTQVPVGLIKKKSDMPNYPDQPTFDDKEESCQTLGGEALTLSEIANLQNEINSIKKRKKQEK